ncbi:MAG: hypothetical protein J0I12_11875 [Candidatus Eremiobacteraeota bacterium]|nr:hypothetical protein [Candidatus Eremiobacteraeota bacterium]
MAIGSATSTSKVSSTSRTGKAKKTKKTGQAKRKRRTQGTKTADKTKLSRESQAAQHAGNTTHTNALAQNFGAKKSGKPDPMNPAAGGPTGIHQSKGTGYYPSNSKMEGGFNDRKGNKLATLQDFLEGKSKYVSVAMDKNQKIPYGKNLNIKELDAKYKDQLKAMGKEHIDFRVTDTGGAFTNKGTGRLDIATRDRKASLDPTINGPLTLDFGK